jgi:hypothetical protein
LEPVQAGAIVAVNFILHFHIGVAEQEASIILGNASLSQAITNGVADLLERPLVATNRMFALVTASQMASAAASFFWRLT